MALGILLILGLGTRLVAIFSALLLLVDIGGIISLGARGIAISWAVAAAAGSCQGAHSLHLDVLRDLLYILPAAWLIWKPASSSRWSGRCWVTRSDLSDCSLNRLLHHGVMTTSGGSGPRRSGRERAAEARRQQAAADRRRNSSPSAA